MNLLPSSNNSGISPPTDMKGQSIVSKQVAATLSLREMALRFEDVTEELTEYRQIMKDSEKIQLREQKRNHYKI